MKTRSRLSKNFALLASGVIILLLGGAETRARALPPFTDSGLRAQWNCAEGSGTALGDSSGNGFAGVLTNGVTWAPGRTGKGLIFDGVSGFVKLPDNLGILNSAPAASVSLWIKPTATTASGSFRELVSLSIGSSSATNTSRVAVSLQGDGAGGQIFAGGRSTDTEAQKNTVTSTGMTVGTWTHVAAVFDFSASTIKVYLNGTLSATNAAAGFASTSTPNTPCRSCALGAQDTGDSNYYQGGMDQVLVYNRALSDSEVTTLAAGDELSAHWMFDEGAGGTAGDSSGNHVDGTLTNGLAWTSGFSGSALSFDGVNDTLNLGSNLSVLQNVNAASVTAWIKPASTLAPNTYRELVSISVNNGSTPTDTSRLTLSLQGDGSAGALFFGARSTDTEAQKNLSFNANLQTNQWYHVGAVADFAGGTLAIYLNGVLVASSNVTFAQPRTANTASTSAALGSQDAGGSNYFHGLMDEVRIYTRPLCACDVQNLAGKDGLRGYWKADEGAGSSLADSSGNTVTGTLTNGMTWATPVQVGSALNFGGVNGTVALGSNLPLLQGVSAATLACWVKPAAAIPSGSYQDLVSISVNAANPTDTSRAVLSLQGNGSGANVFTGGRSTDTESLKSFVDTTHLTPGTWYHIASTIDYQNNKLQVYINGVLTSSTTIAFEQTTSANTASRNAALGSQDAGDGNFLNGLLDEVRVYCRVLSAAEIQSLSSVVPAAPTGLAATGGDQQVSLTWNASSGAASYNVKRSATSNGTYTVVGMSNTTSFTDAGLTNGTAYYYKVSADNLSGESADSSAVSATPGAPPAPPIPPTGLAATAGDQKVDLTWTASSGATSYKIKRSTTNGSGYAVVANVTGTTFINTGLVNATTYFFVVTALNSIGESGNSNQASATPAASSTGPSAPSGLTALPGDQNVLLTWAASPDATSYNVKGASGPGGPYSLRGSSTGTSFLVTGLTNNQIVYFVVTAVNAIGESGNSNEASATPVAPLPVPPSLAATQGNAQVALTWTASAGASSYTVRRGTTSGTYPTTFPGIVATTYTDTSALNGTTYFYVVTATNATGTSGNSNQVSATPIAPPGNLVATPGNNQVTISWSASAGATTYKVKRGTASGGPYSTVFSDIAASPYVDSTSLNGTTYYYVVTAVNAGGESGNSAQVSATPPGSAVPSAPTNLQASAGNAQVSLTWTASATGNPTTYTVKRSETQGSGYGFLGTSGTTSYLDTTAVNTHTYYYVVTATNGTGESGNSNEASAMPADLPPPPTGLTGQAHEAMVELNWTPVPGGNTAGYNVYRAPAAGGPFTKVNDLADLVPSFEDFDLPNGTHYYAVRSVSLSSQESGNSNVIPVVVAAIDPPSGLTATGKNSRVSLSWQPVQGAFSYNVMRATLADGPYTTVGNTTSTSMDATGLTNGTPYFFVVTSVTSAGESRSSAVASATPNPPSFGVLFVVGSASLNSADAAIQQRLVDLGYAPTIEVNSTTTSGATGMKLVVLSATCNAGTVGATFAGLAVPVLNLNPGLMNPLGMTGNSTPSDFGSAASQQSIAMVAANAAHPLAANLLGTVTILGTPGDSVTYGKPNGNAVSIATLTSDTTKSTLFAYEAGAGMVSGTALARRTGAFVGPTSASGLTPEGKTLFDAAVAWTVGAATAPLIVEITPGGDSIRLNWQKSADALSYRVYRALAADGPWVWVSGEVSGTTFSDFNVAADITYFYRVVALNDLGPGVALLVQQGRLPTITYAMMIEGPRTLQAKMPNGTLLPDHYNIGIYTPVVHKITTARDANGDVTSVTSVNANSELSGVVTYELDPGAAQNQPNVVEQGWPNTLNPLQLNTTVNLGTIFLRCGVRKVGEQNIFLYGYFSVTVDTRYNMAQVFFKFPNCTPQAARTQLDSGPPPPQDPNQTIPPNADLWGTETQQSRSRGYFLPRYVTRANELWKQASIRWYGTTGIPDDIVLPPPGDTSTWFHPSNNGFITDRRRRVRGSITFPTSLQFTALTAFNSHQGETFFRGVNVYFFQAIYSNRSTPQGATVHGVTYGADGPDDRRRNTVVLADTGIASGKTLAHEIGHVLFLEHVGEARPNDEEEGVVLDPVAPGVNNMVPLIPLPARNGYDNQLMYRVDNPGLWLPANQADAARAELRRRSTIGGAGYNLSANQEP